MSIVYQVKTSCFLSTHQYGGMDLSMMTRLKELEAENARLKRMYADERLKSDILQDALSKKF